MKLLILIVIVVTVIFGTFVMQAASAIQAKQSAALESIMKGM